MAISLLLTKPSSIPTKQIFSNNKLYHKNDTVSVNPILKPCSSLRTDNNNITISNNHKLFWQKELEQAFKDQLSDHYDSTNDNSFQELVDKRCVDNIRMLIVDAVQNAKAGHPGMALGMAEVGYVLYRHAMKYNSRNPKWFNRDRFVLSAGHGCLLQYVCLHLAGFQSVQVSN